MMSRSLSGRVGLGTAPLGSTLGGPLWWGPQDRDVAVRTVVAAAEAGVGWIDTAPFYGWGRAEEIVGEALSKLRGPRPLVLTKCGTVRDASGRACEDTSPSSIRRDVEASLRRLGVERIDVVQVHDPGPTVPIEETWGALMDLLAKGSIAAAGLSNHPPDLLERAAAVGPVAVVQHQYSLLHRLPEHNGVLDWCGRRGVPFLAWSPLASGFLTDGFHLDVLHPDDLRHRLVWATTRREQTAAARRALHAVAGDLGCSIVAVALAWVLHRPGVHAIVGARTPEEAVQLAQPLPELDDATIRRLEAGTA